MQANPDKFQAIMLGLKGYENCKSLNICGTEKSDDSVKRLGVTFDCMLNFDQHISEICKKRPGIKMFFYVLANTCLRKQRFLSTNHL